MAIKNIYEGMHIQKNLSQTNLNLLKRLFLPRLNITNIEFVVYGDFV
jgi:hypothetical protein